MTPSIIQPRKTHDGSRISCIDRLGEDYIYMLSRAKQNLTFCRYPGGRSGPRNWLDLAGYQLQIEPNRALSLEVAQ